MHSALGGEGVSKRNSIPRNSTHEDGSKLILRTASRVLVGTRIIHMGVKSHDDYHRRDEAVVMG
jgi:hypothetical protein